MKRREENFEEEVDQGICFEREVNPEVHEQKKKKDVEEIALGIENLEDEFGVSAQKELSNTVKAVSDRLIPMIKSKLQDYKEVYETANDQTLKEEVITTLQSAHKADNEVIKLISDQYLDTDDDVLALAGLETADIKDKISAVKDSIFQVKKKIAEHRINLKKFQLANLRLKTRLVKFIS